MYNCPYCHKDMQDNRTCTCTANQFIKFSDGEVLPAVPFKVDVSEICGDCGIRGGGYHHPECDMEQCPKCGGQLISCGHSFDSRGQFFMDRLSEPS